MKKIILASLLGLASSAYAAQEPSTTSTLEVTKEGVERIPQGWLPFIELGGGYTGYDTLSDVEGAPSTIKLMGSYYFERPYVFDLAWGGNNQQFSQPKLNQEKAISGGAADMSIRYRWDNRWQAGLSATQLSEQGKYYSADQADALFGGLQVLREFNMTTNWVGRIGARAMGLTNNTGNLVTMYLIDFQFGWDAGATKPSVRQTAAEASPVAPARPIAQVEPTTSLKDISFANLFPSASTIQFKSARTGIATQDREKLAKVAKVLNENKDLFESVEIHGYTDASGSPMANQKISQERAEKVREVLQRGGLKDVDVLAMGKGSSSASGNLKADRRAELVIIGVKDEAKLREVLSGIE